VRWLHCQLLTAKLCSQQFSFLLNPYSMIY